jgi:hypothetical protein
MLLVKTVHIVLYTFLALSTKINIAEPGAVLVPYVLILTSWIWLQGRKTFTKQKTQKEIQKKKTI